MLFGSVFFEYEEVLGRAEFLLDAVWIRATSDGFSMRSGASGCPWRSGFSGRPQLRDRKTEMVLEAAVNAGCRGDRDHNSDFRQVPQRGSGSDGWPG